MKTNLFAVLLPVAFLVSLLTFWFLFWQWAGSPLPIEDEAQTTISRERN